MDNVTRHAQQRYIEADPHNRDSSSKECLFMLEFVKFRSKIRDLIKEKRVYMVNFKSLIENALDKADKLDLSTACVTSREVRSQIDQIIAGFISVRENMLSKEYTTLDRRLRFTCNRFAIMVKRVKGQVNLMSSPEENPGWKRIPNPELNANTVLTFINMSLALGGEVEAILFEGNKVFGQFLDEFNKYLTKIHQLIFTFTRQIRKNVQKKMSAEKREIQAEAEEFNPKRKRAE